MSTKPTNLDTNLELETKKRREALREARNGVQLKNSEFALYRGQSIQEFCRRLATKEKPTAADREKATTQFLAQQLAIAANEQEKSAILKKLYEELMDLQKIADKTSDAADSQLVEFLKILEQKIKDFVIINVMEDMEKNPYKALDLLRVTQAKDPEKIYELIIAELKKLDPNRQNEITLQETLFTLKRQQADSTYYNRVILYLKNKLQSENEAAISNLDKEIKGLKKQEAELRKQINQMPKNISDQTRNKAREHEELIKAIARKTTQIEKMKNTLKEQQQKYEQLRGNTEAQILTLDREHTAMSQERTTLVTEIQSLEKEAKQRAEAEMAKRKSQIADYEKKIEQEDKRKLEEIEKENLTAVSAIRDEYETEKKKIFDSLQEDIAKRMELQDEIKNKKEKIKQKIAKKENELKTIEASLKADSRLQDKIDILAVYTMLGIASTDKEILSELGPKLKETYRKAIKTALKEAYKKFVQNNHIQDNEKLSIWDIEYKELEEYINTQLDSVVEGNNLVLTKKKTEKNKKFNKLANALNENLRESIVEKRSNLYIRQTEEEVRKYIKEMLGFINRKEILKKEIQALNKELEKDITEDLKDLNKKLEDIRAAIFAKEKQIKDLETEVVRAIDKKNEEKPEKIAAEKSKNQEKIAQFKQKIAEGRELTDQEKNIQSNINSKNKRLSTLGQEMSNNRTAKTNLETTLQIAKNALEAETSALATHEAALTSDLQTSGELEKEIANLNREHDRSIELNSDLHNLGLDKLITLRNSLTDPMQFKFSDEYLIKLYKEISALSGPNKSTFKDFQELLLKLMQKRMETALANKPLAESVASNLVADQLIRDPSAEEISQVLNNQRAMQELTQLLEGNLKEASKKISSIPSAVKNLQQVAILSSDTARNNIKKIAPITVESIPQAQEDEVVLLCKRMDDVIGKEYSREPGHDDAQTGLREVADKIKNKITARATEIKEKEEQRKAREAQELADAEAEKNRLQQEQKEKENERRMRAEQERLQEEERKRKQEEDLKSSAEKLRQRRAEQEQSIQQAQKQLMVFALDEVGNALRNSKLAVSNNAVVVLDQCLKENLGKIPDLKILNTDIDGKYQVLEMMQNVLNTAFQPLEANIVNYTNKIKSLNPEELPDFLEFEMQNYRLAHQAALENAVTELEKFKKNIMRSNAFSEEDVGKNEVLAKYVDYIINDMQKINFLDATSSVPHLIVPSKDTSLQNNIAFDERMEALIAIKIAVLNKLHSTALQTLIQENKDAYDNLIAELNRISSEDQAAALREERRISDAELQRLIRTSFPKAPTGLRHEILQALQRYQDAMEAHHRVAEDLKKYKEIFEQNQQEEIKELFEKLSKQIASIPAEQGSKELEARRPQLEPITTGREDFAQSKEPKTEEESEQLQKDEDSLTALLQNNNLPDIERLNLELKRAILQTYNPSALIKALKKYESYVADFILQQKMEQSANVVRAAMQDVGAANARAKSAEAAAQAAVQDRLTALSEQLEETKRRAETEQQKAESIQANLAEQTSNVASLTEALASARTQIEAGTGDRAELTKRAEDLVNKLNAAESSVSALRTEVDSANARAKSAEAAAQAAVQERLTALSEQLEETKRRAETEQQKAESIQANLAEQTSNVASLTEALASARTQIAAGTGDRAELTKRAEDLVNKLNAAESSVSALRTEVDSANARAESAEAAAQAAVQERLTALSEQLEETKRRAEAEQQKAESIQANLAEQTSNVASLTEALVSARTQIAAGTGDRAELTKRAEDLVNKLNAAESSVSALRTEVDSANVRAKSAEAAAQAAVQERLTALSEQLEETKRRAETEQQKSESIQANLAEQTSNVASLTEALASARTQIEAGTGDRAELTKRTEDLVNKLNAAESSVSALRTEVDSANARAKSAEAAAQAAVQERLTALSEQLEETKRRAETEQQKAESIQANLAEQTSNVASLTEALASARTQIAAGTGDRAELTKRAEDLVNKLNAAESSVSALRTEVDSANARAESAEAAAQAAVQERLTALSEQLEETKRRAETEQQKAESIQANLAEQTSNVASLTEALASARTQIEAGTGDRAELTKRAEDLVNKLNAAESSVSALRTEVDSANARAKSAEAAAQAAVQEQLKLLEAQVAEAKMKAEAEQQKARRSQELTDVYEERALTAEAQLRDLRLELFKQKELDSGKSAVADQSVTTIAELQENLAAMQQSNIDLKQRLDQALSTVRPAQEKSARLEQQLSNIEQQLAAANDAAINAAQQAAAAQREADKYRTAAANTDSLQQELNASRARVAILNKENKGLLDNLDAAKIVPEKEKKARMAAEERARQAEEQKAKAEAELQAIKAAQNQLLTEVQAAKHAEQVMIEIVNSLKQENAKLGGKLKATETNLDQAIKDKNIAAQELSIIRDQAHELNAQVATSKQALADDRAKAESLLRSETVAHTTKIAAIQHQLQGENERLKAENSRITAENRALRAENTQLKADNIRLSAENKALADRLAAMEAAFAQLKTEKIREAEAKAQADAKANARAAADSLLHPKNTTTIPSPPTLEGVGDELTFAADQTKSNQRRETSHTDKVQASPRMRMTVGEVEPPSNRIPKATIPATHALTSAFDYYKERARKVGEKEMKKTQVPELLTAPGFKNLCEKMNTSIQKKSHIEISSPDALKAEFDAYNNARVSKGKPPKTDYEKWKKDREAKRVVFENVNLALVAPDTYNVQVKSADLERPPKTTAYIKQLPKSAQVELGVTLPLPAIDDDKAQNEYKQTLIIMLENAREIARRTGNNVIYFDQCEGCPDKAHLIEEYALLMKLNPKFDKASQDALDAYRTERGIAAPNRPEVPSGPEEPPTRPTPDNVLSFKSPRH